MVELQQEEIWKDVKGYKGIYQISNFGRVKSLARFIIVKNHKRFLKEKMIKTNIDIYGYEYFIMNKNCHKKHCKIHRLVAETFLENPFNYTMINHKDENKQNNNVNNLEWCNAKYNLNYGNRSKKYMKPVAMIDLNTNKIIKIFKSLKDVEIELKINHSKVSSVCHNHRKSAGGYKWKFLSEVNNEN